MPDRKPAGSRCRPARLSASSRRCNISPASREPRERATRGRTMAAPLGIITGASVSVGAWGELSTAIRC